MSYLSFGYYGKPEDNDPKLDNRLSYILNKSAILTALSEFDKSDILLEEAISYSDYLNDKYYLCTAYIEKGIANVKLGKKQKGIDYLNTAFKYTPGIVWEDGFKNRIKVYLRSLGQEDVEVIKQDDLEEMEKEEEMED